MADILTAYIDSRVTAGRAPRTIGPYRDLARQRIIPAIGSRKATDLRPADLERFCAEQLSGPRLDKKGGDHISPATVAKMHAIIHAAFRHALRQGTITRNLGALPVFVTGLLAVRVPMSPLPAGLWGRAWGRRRRRETSQGAALDGQPTAPPTPRQRHGSADMGTGILRVLRSFSLRASSNPADAATPPSVEPPEQQVLAREQVRTLLEVAHDHRPTDCFTWRSARACTKGN